MKQRKNWMRLRNLLIRYSNSRYKSTILITDCNTIWATHICSNPFLMPVISFQISNSAPPGWERRNKKSEPSAGPSNSPSKPTRRVHGVRLFTSIFRFTITSREKLIKCLNFFDILILYVFEQYLMRWCVRRRNNCSVSTPKRLQTGRRASKPQLCHCTPNTVLCKL